jgi:hypothetical protein
MKGIKKDHWDAIVVHMQAVKNESKGKWKHPYVSLTKRMKSLFGVCSMYDHFFSEVAIIITCVFVVDVRCTIYVRVWSTMTMSIKVQKPSLVIRMSTHCGMWWGEKWETSFWTCASLSKTIIAIVFQGVSWPIVFSFLQGHQIKWVHNVVMKWAKNKQNAGVVRQVNN